MRSPNWFWTSDRFISLASWLDRSGPFALWPAAMVETQVDLGADVQSTRWTFAWGRRRWQIDLARYTPRAFAGKIDWTAGPGGVEEMLRWAKRVFRRSWAKADIEKLFVKKPEWRRLVIQSGTRHHYVRVLLARELMEQENGPNQPEVLTRAYTSAAEHLASALRMPRADEKNDSEWSNASLDARRRRPLRPLGTVEGQDPMEQLDHLANLLDLPQQVRDLGEERENDPLDDPAPLPTVAADALIATPVPPPAAAPLPSYLPMPTLDPNDEAARQLAASLGLTGEPDVHPDHHDLAKALMADDATFKAEVPPNARSAATAPNALPSFLPSGPASSDDAARHLAEALERTRDDSPPSPKEPSR